MVFRFPKVIQNISFVKNTTFRYFEYKLIVMFLFTNIVLKFISFLDLLIGIFFLIFKSDNPKLQIQIN